MSWSVLHAAKSEALLALPATAVILLVAVKPITQRPVYGNSKFCVH